MAPWRCRADLATGAPRPTAPSAPHRTGHNLAQPLGATRGVRSCLFRSALAHASRRDVAVGSCAPLALHPISVAVVGSGGGDVGGLSGVRGGGVCQFTSAGLGGIGGSHGRDPRPHRRLATHPSPPMVARFRRNLHRPHRLSGDPWPLARYNLHRRFCPRHCGRGSRTARRDDWRTCSRIARPTASTIGVWKVPEPRPWANNSAPSISATR
jgi:hypothetical protein